MEDAYRNPPLLRRRRNMQRHPIIQPIRKRTPNHQKLLKQARNPTPHGRRTILRHKDGRDAAHATDAQAGDEAAAIHLADGMQRRRLHGRADEKDEREGEQRVAAAELLVERRREDGAEEAAGGEEGDDILGDARVFGGGEAGRFGGEVEVLLEGLEGEDGAHDAGVVAWCGGGWLAGVWREGKSGLGVVCSYRIGESPCRLQR